MVAVLLQIAAFVSFLALCARPAAPNGRLRWGWVLPLLLLLSSVALAGDSSVVRKWLARLAMPHGWFFMLLFAAACVAWWTGRRREAIAATGLWTLFTIAGNTWLSQSLVGRLEANYRRPLPTEPPFDVVVVLGGGAGVTHHGEPQLSTSGDRIALAARLFHQGLAPAIACTSSTLNGSPEEDTPTLLRFMGVPDAAIVPLPVAAATREELEVVSAMREERGWKRIGLLTSAWHLPRAMGNARRAGLDDVVPIPADHRATAAPARIVHLIPSSEGFGNLRLVVWELLGMAMGR